MEEKEIGYLHMYRPKLDAQDDGANYLARCLLMPKTSFIKLFNKLKNSTKREDVPQQLALKFAVPVSQCELRIADLKLHY